jgi:hypothetical protein
MPMFLPPSPPPLFAGAAVDPASAKVVEAAAPLSTVFVDPSPEMVKVAIVEPETPATVKVVPISSGKTAALALVPPALSMQHATESTLLGEQQNWLEGHSITLFHIDGNTGSLLNSNL